MARPRRYETDAARKAAWRAGRNAGRNGSPDETPDDSAELASLRRRLAHANRTFQMVRTRQAELRAQYPNVRLLMDFCAYIDYAIEHGRDADVTPDAGTDAGSVAE